MQLVGIKVSDIPTYEGLPKLAYFLIEFEEKVIEPQLFSTLDFALKDITTRWWVAHKKYTSEWP